MAASKKPSYYRLLQKDVKDLKAKGLVSKSFKANQKTSILEAEVKSAKTRRWNQTQDERYAQAKAEWEKETKRQRDEQAKRANDEYESWINSCFNTTYEMPVGNSWDTNFRTALNRGYCEAEARNCADILKSQPTSKIAIKIKESIYA